MVEVSLRKANQLEEQALAAGRETALNATLSVSVYESRPIEELLDAARDRVQGSLLDALALIEASYKIRSLSSEKNASSGINKLLLEKALIEAQERMVHQYTSGEPFERENASIEVLSEKLKSMRTRLDASTRGGYGIEDRVAVPVLREAEFEMLRDRLVVLRDRKTAVLDELMQRNWTVKVTLPDSLIELLRKHKIAV